MNQVLKTIFACGCAAWLVLGQALSAQALVQELFNDDMSFTWSSASVVSSNGKWTRDGNGLGFTLGDSFLNQNPTMTGTRMDLGSTYDGVSSLGTSVKANVFIAPPTQLGQEVVFEYKARVDNVKAGRVYGLFAFTKFLVSGSNRQNEFDFELLGNTPTNQLVSSFRDWNIANGFGNNNNHWSSIVSTPNISIERTYTTKWKKELNGTFSLEWLVDNNQIAFLNNVAVPGADSRSIQPIINTWKAASDFTAAFGSETGASTLSVDSLIINRVTIPEPTSFALAMLGLTTLVGTRRYRL